MKLVSKIFDALSHPIRRQILQDLKVNELTAGEMVQRYGISGPSMSRHFTILSNAGLIQERREGNRIFYSLVPEPLIDTLGSFLSSVCPTQIQYRQKRKKEKT